MFRALLDTGWLKIFKFSKTGLKNGMETCLIGLRRLGLSWPRTKIVVVAGVVAGGQKPM